MLSENAESLAPATAGVIVIAEQRPWPGYSA